MVTYAGKGNRVVAPCLHACLVSDGPVHDHRHPPVGVYFHELARCDVSLPKPEPLLLQQHSVAAPTKVPGAGAVEIGIEVDFVVLEIIRDRCLAASDARAGAVCDASFTPAHRHAAALVAAVALPALDVDEGLAADGGELVLAIGESIRREFHFHAPSRVGDGVVVGVVAG